MKLLYWTPFYTPEVGGIEVLASQTLPRLINRGYEIEVISGRGLLPTPPTDTIDGVRVHYFDFHKMFTLQDIKAIFKTQKQIDNILDEFRPDVVHLILSDPSLFFYQRSRSNKPPCVAAIHSDINRSDEQQVAGTLFWNCIKNAAWITSVCRQSYTKVLEQLPTKLDVLSVQFNPVDTEIFFPSPTKVDTPRLLCLGRLVPVKALSRAIDVMKIVLQRFPNTILTIAGDGVEQNRLVEQALSLGISKSIEFVGQIGRDTVPKTICDSTVVLITSKSEGFPMVALEAASCGRPVVTFPVGSVDEVVKNGETGLIVPQGDIDSFAKAILALLSDDELVTKMGEAARMHVQKNFGFQSYIDRHDQIYTNVISRPRSQ